MLNNGHVLGAAAALLTAWVLLREKPDEEAEAIRSLALDLDDEGAAVFADIKGFSRPPIINGHIPDVFALMDDGSQLAVEFENERSVRRTHARRQDKAFTKWAKASPKKRAYVQEIIPGGKGRRS